MRQSILAFLLLLAFLAPALAQPPAASPYYMANISVDGSINRDPSPGSSNATLVGMGVNATAAELNVLHLSGLTSGWVLRATGSSSAAFAALQAGDIPSLAASSLTSGTIATARLGSGSATSSTFLRGDQTWAAPTASQVGAVSSSVMTTIGDLLYGGASGVATRLAGDTSNTKKFLTSTASGGVATAPAWATLVAGDVPSLAASILTSGQVALARGGTGVDLSASGGSTSFLAQDASHVVSARTIASGDLPNHSAALLTSGTVGLARGGLNADVSGIAKGGLFAGSGSGAVGITAVGSDGQVLTADAASANGVKWAAGGSSTFIGCSVYLSATQSVSTLTWVNIPFDGRNLDPGSICDITTNKGRITVATTGKYRFRLHVSHAGGCDLRYLVNGIGTPPIQSAVASGYSEYEVIIALTAGDYVQPQGYFSAAQLYQVSGSWLTNSTLHQDTTMVVSFLGT